MSIAALRQCLSVTRDEAERQVIVGDSGGIVLLLVMEAAMGSCSMARS
jgi:hypothetical protein